MRISYSALLQIGDDEVKRATIIDVSEQGFRLQTEEPLYVGQRLTILRTKEAFDGTILWVRENEAGGLFLTPAKGLT